MSETVERHFRAWMADDGYHVEFSHPCDPPENNVRGTLPHPTWKAENGRVVPSINCQKCGLHEYAVIGDKPLLIQAVDDAISAEGGKPEGSHRMSEPQEVEVELWSTDPNAIEAVRRTFEGMGGMLFERDGRWFVGTLNPGYIRFAAEHQGYVKRVIPESSAEGEK